MAAYVKLREQLAVAEKKLKRMEGKSSSYALGYAQGKAEANERAKAMPDQDEIGKWGDETFPGGTVESCLHHFIDELAELFPSESAQTAVDLLHACLDRDGYELNEADDLVILLMQCAHRYGYNLLESVVAKHQVNVHRQWGEPDEFGIVRHIDPDTQEGAE